MDYLTVREINELWGISTRRICKLCEEGRIAGAIKKGGVWFIPSTAQKPKDARIKTGKYLSSRSAC